MLHVSLLCIYYLQAFLIACKETPFKDERGLLSPLGTTQVFELMTLKPIAFVINWSINFL